MTKIGQKSFWVRREEDQIIKDIDKQKPHIYDGFLETDCGYLLKYETDK